MCRRKGCGQQLLQTKIMAFFGDDPFFNESGFNRPFMIGFPDPFNGRRPRYMTPAIYGPQPQGLSAFGMVDPFQRMNDLMMGMGNISSSGNTGCHTFTQQTVMHYSNDSRSKEPKMYQACSSTKSCPGGIKETRKLEKNSVTGTQKTSISHQIGERSCTVKKNYNYKTKEAEQIQEFINMDEDDTPQFEADWKRQSRTLELPEPRPEPRGLPSCSRNWQTSPRFTPYSEARRAHGHSRVDNMQQHSELQQLPRLKKSTKVKFHPKNLQ